MTCVQRPQPHSSISPSMPTERLRRRYLLALTGIVLVAFGLRLAFWWGQSANNPLFSHPTLDEETHHQLAQAVATGRGVGAEPFFRAPLYYYLLGALYALVGPSPAAARLLGCVLGTISCLLIAQLGRALGGMAVGLLAGVIAAVYWPMIFFDNQLQTVGLEVLLDVSMMLLFVRGAQKGAWPLFLAAGVVWGLSAITRANILVIGPALLTALWLWPRAASQRPARRLLFSGLLLAGAAAVVLPVTLRNRSVGGEWVPIASSGGINFYIGNNPRSDGRSAIVPEIGYFWSGRFEGTQYLPESRAGHKLSHSEVSDFWFDRAKTWIRANPGAWVKLLGHKCRLFFSPLEIPNDHPIGYFASLSGVTRILWIGFPVVAALGIAGLALLGRSLRTWLLPVLFVPSYAVGVVLFFCPARFRLPVVPVLILLGALGVVRAIQLLAARRLKLLAVYAAIGALAAVFIATNPPDRATLNSEGESMGHLQLGQLYARLAVKDPPLREKARQEFRNAVDLRPDDWTARRAFGACCVEMGLIPEAYEQLSSATQLSKTDPDNFYYLGTCLEAMQKPDEAVDAYRHALDLLAHTAAQPKYLTDMHHRLGVLLAERGEFAAAIAELEEVLRREPNHVLALLNLGGALAETQRYDEAAARYRQALACEPGNAAALRNLEHALRAAGHSGEEVAREQVAALELAARQAPKDASLAARLAWQLATSPYAGLRSGPRAVALVQQVMPADARPDPTLLQALAAAYAECGRFDEAAATAEQVLQMAHAAGRSREAAWIEAQLAGYREKRPFRESE